LVRFADDFVGCFQFQDAAQNFQRQLRRFARFNLVLGETSSRSQVGSVRALARKRQQQRGSAKTTASRLVSTILYDLWVHQWRQRCATGDVVVVRYADDTIVGFEHRYEAEQFLADLKARFARFGLTLHPDKTRLIEFGRSAIADRRARGLGKPESFDFLGFTHYCATRRSGSGFVLGRKPVAKRMRAKLREIKEQLMAMRHEGTERQGRWLCQVLDGLFHLLDWLVAQGIRRVHACLESTGHYSLGIACALYEAGHIVSIINPAQVRDFVRTKLGRNKTDGILADDALPAGIRSRFVDGVNGLRMHVLEAGF
jgi:hypothetical protein